MAEWTSKVTDCTALKQEVVSAGQATDAIFYSKGWNHAAVSPSQINDSFNRKVCAKVQSWTRHYVADRVQKQTHYSLQYDYTSAKDTQKQSYLPNNLVNTVSKL